MEAQQAVPQLAANNVLPIPPMSLVAEPAAPQSDFSSEDFHQRFAMNGEILGQVRQTAGGACTG